MAPSRRQFLGSTAVGIMAAIAGCAAMPSDDATETESPTETSGGLPDAVKTDYRQSQYDTAQTGYRERTAPTEDAQIRWTVRNAEAGPSYSVGSPVVADGTVYFAEAGEASGEGVSSSMYAVDALSGEVDWQASLPDSNVFRGPAVRDGTVLQRVGGGLVALDANSGDQQWSVSKDLDSGVTATRGAAYVSGRGYSGPTKLYAFRTDSGEERWQADLSGGMRVTTGAPAVADGTVVVAEGNAIRGFDAEDGSEVWRHETDGSFTTPPTLVDGAVYLGDRNGTVHAYDLGDGAKRWEAAVPSGGSGGQSPLANSVAVGDGRVVVVSTWQATALDVESGEEVWTTEISGSGPPVIADETVYVTGLSSLEALDATSGDRLWSVSTNAESGTPTWPAVVDGVVYFASAGLQAVA